MKHRIVCCLVLMAVGLSLGAGTPCRLEIPDYEVLEASKSALRFPSDSAALAGFHATLGRVLDSGYGRVSVMHIGGSHVQAGSFSNRVRSRLAGLFAEQPSPRGMLFPYRAGKTNNPADYEVAYAGEWTLTRNVSKQRNVRLGLSGIAVTTGDTAAYIRVRLNRDTACWDRFDQVWVLGDDDSGAWEPTLKAYGEGESEPMDSVTGVWDELKQRWCFEFDRDRDVFKMSFRRIPGREGEMNFHLKGFDLENRHSGVAYHAIGVNGASVDDYLRCEDFERDLDLVVPDLVIFGIGINDASRSDFTPESFFLNYDTLVGRIREVSPRCALIFVTNNDSYIRRTTPNPKGVEAREVFYRLAERHGGAVFDVFDMMGGLSSAARWEEAQLMKADKIHFTDKGYRLVGDLLFNALMDDFVRYRKGGNHRE